MGNKNLTGKFIYALQDPRAEKVETKIVIFKNKLWEAFHQNCDQLNSHFIFMHAPAISGARRVHPISTAKF